MPDLIDIFRECEGAGYSYAGSSSIWRKQPVDGKLGMQVEELRMRGVKKGGTAPILVSVSDASARKKRRIPPPPGAIPGTYVRRAGKQRTNTYKVLGADEMIRVADSSVPKGATVTRVEVGCR
jgi:hypothetical protein